MALDPMQAGMLDQDLRAFIQSAVGSSSALHALLLMHSRPGREWTFAALLRELKTHPKRLVESLSAFETAGIVRRMERGFAYLPAMPAMEEMVARLARAQRDRPAEVAEALGAAFDRRLQAFSEAFRR